MRNVSNDRLEMEEAVADWLKVSNSERRRTLAPALLSEMIDVLSGWPRQDHSKEHLSKAIEAVARGDTGSAGMLMMLALREPPHAPVQVQWDDLRGSVARLQNGSEADVD